MSVAATLLVAALLVATLGEGGASPGALLVTHLLALAAACCTLGARERRCDPGIAAAFAGFAAWAVVSAAAAPYAYAAFLAGVEITVVGAVGLSSARLGPAFLRAFAPGLAVGVAVHALVAVVERLSGSARPSTSFLNTNHLAAWLVAAGIVVAGASSRWSRAARIAARCALALAGIAFVAIASRGAAVSLAAAGGTALVLYRGGLSSRARRVALAAGTVGVVAVVGAIAWRFHVSPDPLAFQRIDIWKASARMAAEHPVLGVGPGQFLIEAPRFNFPLEGRALRYGHYFPSPHSDLLRSAAELGLPATLAAALGLFALVRIVARRRREGRLEPAVGACACAIAGLAAQGLVDDLTGRPALYLLAAALVGALASREAEASVPALRVRVVAAAALTVAWSILDLTPYLAWRAERAGEPDRSVRLVPVAARPWIASAETLSAKGTREAYLKARQAADRATGLSPHDATLARRALRIEGEACRTLFPIVGYRRAIAERWRTVETLSPHDPRLPLDAAAFLLSTGDPDGAADAARRAVAIEPTAALPRLALAEALGAAGRKAEAASELDRAERLEREGEAESRESAYAAAMLRLPEGRAERLRAGLEPVPLAPRFEDQHVP